MQIGSEFDRSLENVPSLTLPPSSLLRSFGGTWAQDHAGALAEAGFQGREQVACEQGISLCGRVRFPGATWKLICKVLGIEPSEPCDFILGLAILGGGKM